jgi:uncharacterized membrane protein YhaH (DUF805 family)
MDPSQLFFGFSGRINRAKYWVAGVINIVSWLIIVVVVWGATSPSSPYFLFLFTFFIVAIPWLISLTAIAVKRLHDRDKSGWWLLVFYVLPGALDKIPEAAGTVLQFIFGLASFAISIWAFVELGCLGGTAGPNKYGSDPLAA